MMLNFWDYIFAIIFAFFITSMLLVLLKMAKQVIARHNKSYVNDDEFEVLKRKCKVIFPLDSIVVNGKTINRETYIEIKYLNDKNEGETLRGLFMGGDSDGVTCVISNQKVLTFKADEIVSVEILEVE